MSTARCSCHPLESHCPIKLLWFPTEFIPTCFPSQITNKYTNTPTKDKIPNWKVCSCHHPTPANPGPCASPFSFHCSPPFSQAAPGLSLRRHLCFLLCFTCTQAPGSLDLSNKTFLTSHFALPWLTVSYVFPCGFCLYRPHPSHGLRTDLTSLNPVLINPWSQSILVLKAEFSGLLSSPDAPLCQSVDPTYHQPWFAISDPYEFFKNIYCLSYSYIEMSLILFHLLHFSMKMKPSLITLALSELLFLLSMRFMIFKLV